MHVLLTLHFTHHAHKTVMMMVMVVDLYGSILMYIPIFIAKFYRCVCVSEYLPFGHKVIEAKKKFYIKRFWLLNKIQNKKKRMMTIIRF